MKNSDASESDDNDTEEVKTLIASASSTVPSAMETWASRVFGVHVTDVAGSSLVAAAGCALMTGYYLIQPLSDQLALHVGVELTPLISVGRLVLIAIINPAYAAFVKNVSVDSIITRLYRMLACTLLLFVLAFAAFSRGNADALVSFAFAVWSGVFSLFMISTFWARVAHLHTRQEAKRVYGLIAAGAEAGQLFGSAIAALLYSFAEQRILLLSILLMEACIALLDMRTRRAPPALTPAPSSTTEPAADAGAEATDAAADAPPTLDRVRDALFGPARTLLSTPLLRQLTLHTLLINILVSGVWYERAEAVAAAFASSNERFTFFSTLNFVVAAATLLVQSLCFSRVLKHLGTTRTLLAEPLALA